MKSRIILIAFASLFLGIFSTHAETQEDFLASYQSSIEQKNTDKILSLYYTVGCSDADKANLALVQKFHFTNGKIKEVTLQPLPSNFSFVNIISGKKYEPTYPPLGIIKITYEPHGGNGMVSGGDGYALIDGKYCLITQKSTDLNWKGPVDKQIGFSVMGKGQDKLQVKYKWNASGVDQEKTRRNPGSIILMGQCMKSVEATSTEDDTDVTLTVSEGGTNIYTSQPLKGKGIIEYNRAN